MPAGTGGHQHQSLPMQTESFCGKPRRPSFPAVVFGMSKTRPPRWAPGRCRTSRASCSARSARGGKFVRVLAVENRFECGVLRLVDGGPGDAMGNPASSLAISIAPARNRMPISTPTRSASAAPSPSTTTSEPRRVLSGLGGRVRPSRHSPAARLSTAGNARVGSSGAFQFPLPVHDVPGSYWRGLVLGSQAASS
jgi:hypothetical protein